MLQYSECFFQQTNYYQQQQQQQQSSYPKPSPTRPEKNQTRPDKPIQPDLIKLSVVVVEKNLTKEKKNNLLIEMPRLKIHHQWNYIYIVNC